MQEPTGGKTSDGKSEGNPSGERMHAVNLQSGGLREFYQREMARIREEFSASGSGAAAVKSRAKLLDEMVQRLWVKELERERRLARAISLVAIGGYGRSELYPSSDLDLMFLVDKNVPEKEMKSAVQRVSQELWDCGVRVSPSTRRPSECEKLDPDNSEFALALLDHRLVAGEEEGYEKLASRVLPKLMEQRGVVSRLVELTRLRHEKYGDTLFHLEPNIKECPGGLRDVHACRWLEKLHAAWNGSKGGSLEISAESAGFGNAVAFLTTVRCFLHYRHDRDDNTLDWQAQDSAAAEGVGLQTRGKTVDAAYWMRVYFRHARSVERRATQLLEQPEIAPSKSGLHRAFRIRQEPPAEGFRLERGRAMLEAPSAAGDPAHDPDIVLQIFATVARSGCRLAAATEERLTQALPILSSQIEEGRALWNRLQAILAGRYAGDALRSMHAVGLLELLIPEFHGIDALAIRDAYHRYTVDEHTFVFIDTLHALESKQEGKMADWAAKFSVMLEELHHPELLYLAALLHDTGKGSAGEHTQESARMAKGLLARLELDSFEGRVVLQLIENHLEMSAALRRDIFDMETVRAFAGKVRTPEMLRMLALFTYADINAVHPDALTPWKAENLWRLTIATANYLDRSVDEERVSSQEESELIDRVVALLPGQEASVRGFLEGLPERYLRTRTPEQIKRHYLLAMKFDEDAVQVEFRYSPDLSELTVVTPDRTLLFARIAGVLAAWGMNIVSAEAFSNERGIVVDSFRFTDGFRTLEMNASEHERFVDSVRETLGETSSLKRILQGRRGTTRRRMITVETQIEFDETSSTHSTLMQVIAQDVSGLLRSVSLTLAEQGCNIEVALVDTEGETAIDVFYLTKDGQKLTPEAEGALRTSLMEAIEGNVG